MLTEQARSEIILNNSLLVDCIKVQHIKINEKHILGLAKNGES